MRDMKTYRGKPLPDDPETLKAIINEMAEREYEVHQRFMDYLDFEAEMSAPRRRLTRLRQFIHALTR